MNDSDLNYDYSHSFISWWSAETHNAPRLALQASCKIAPVGGAPKEYFLSCTCAGEQMYVDTGMIHEPVAEFSVVASVDGEFMFEKRIGQPPWCSRMIYRVGDTVPSHDGKGRTISKMEVTLRRYTEVRPLSQVNSR